MPTTEIIPIKLRDGSTNEITLCRSENSNVPLIFVFPALGVRASYYKTLLEKLAQNGFHVCLTDWRGNGKSSVRPSRTVNFGYKELIEDIDFVIEKIGNQFPDNKKYLLGHSLGGQLGGLFLSKKPPALDGIVLIASCSVYYKGCKGWAGTRIYYATYLIKFLGKIVGYYPGEKMGFGGSEARGVMQDWGRNGRTGKYIIDNDDFDYEAALAQLQTNILAISIKGDTFAPVEATKNLYQKYHPNSTIRHEVVSAQDAQIKNLGHFNWAKHPDHFIGLLKDWS